jgi:hypothetical protein
VCAPVGARSPARALDGEVQGCPAQVIRDARLRAAGKQVLRGSHRLRFHSEVQRRQAGRIPPIHQVAPIVGRLRIDNPASGSQKNGVTSSSSRVYRSATLGITGKSVGAVPP